MLPPVEGRADALARRQARELGDEIGRVRSGAHDADRSQAIPLADEALRQEAAIARIDDADPFSAERVRGNRACIAAAGIEVDTRVGRRPLLVPADALEPRLVEAADAIQRHHP